MVAACTADWTTVVAALLTPLIAVLAVLIAYQQWRVAQNKLQLDLFERRLAIYNGAVQFLKDAARREDYGDPLPWLIEYMTATDAARWLLDDSVDKYLTRLLDEARVLRHGPDDDRIQWFFKSTGELKRQFDPFLSVRHQTSFRPWATWKRLSALASSIWKRLSARASRT